MTAAWCVTCLVNERIALSSDAVKRAFAERKVAYLKGDWTRADPAISDFLREHGRDGVPLYVLFPPKGGDGSSCRKCSPQARCSRFRPFRKLKGDEIARDGVATPT